MYKVYGKGGQRSAKICWLLSELQVPYESVAISLSPQSESYAQLLKLNPFAKVPILQKDEFVIWESAAIMCYLIEAHRDTRPMAPEPGTQARAQHDMFFFAAHTDFEEPLWTIARHKFVFPEDLRNEGAVRAARFDWKQKAQVLEGLIPVQDYLLGQQFTAADIALAYVLNWANEIGLLNPFENLLHYLARCKARSSCALPTK